MLRDMSALQLALAILGVGFLIAWHELGHYTVARLLGMRVLRYSLGFGPKLFGFTRGGIEYRLSALPLGGYVQIKGMSSLEDGAAEDPKSFINRPRWARWLVLAAGPGFNYAFAFAMFVVLLSAWPSPVATHAVELTDVTADSPAAAAGLKPGDFIIAVNGEPVAATSTGFKESIASRQGGAVDLTVLRGDARFDVAVTPRQVDGGLVIGVMPSLRQPASSLPEIVAGAAMRCWTETTRTLSALGALVRREPGVDVSGPIGIVAQMKDQIARGSRFFLYILAVLSVNLGLFNLLPIPSLDGIKMLFLTVEGIARRDINAKAQVWVNAVGLMALLLMLVVVSIRDGMKL
jgi:regulator of sigma E protease